MEAEDEDDLCVYVDQGQCGRESGDGRPGELEMETGRGEDMLDAVGGVVVATFFVCTECGGGSQTEKREPKAAQQVR